MIDPSQVNIIIPHLGGTKETEYSIEQCIASLRETSDIRIIVVTNGNKCMSRHEADEWIQMDRQGQAGAVNAAVATTDTPWIFVTNDDMIYAPGWWEKLTENMIYIPNQVQVGRDVGIKCISPMLIEPRPGAPTFEVAFCGGAGGDFDKQKWLQYVLDHNDTPHPKVIRTGFNLPFLIKRDLWDTIGGYDINYDPWGSNGDSDLEYKIRLAGVQPYQNTNCIVYHFSQTSGTFHPDNRKYWQDNWDYFIEKWGFPRTDDGIWEATFKIPTKEEGRLFNPDWENKYGN